VPLPESIGNYLRAYASDLRAGILDSFPPLHAVDDPPSPMIGKLLWKAYPAQILGHRGPRSPLAAGSGGSCHR
jgi:hypothetical protein